MIPHEHQTCKEPPTVHPETVQFLDDLFGDQAGQLCLGFIDGDPSIPKGQPGYAPMKQEWYDWPKDREAVEEHIAWHDEHGHNTYVRMCLFKRQKATIVNALPSSIIWRDDVKDLNTPCSLLIETSAGNYQAIIKLDRPATTEERRRLMIAWRNAHRGSDDCSADAVHFVRIPGGHNSKRHGWFPVRYAQRTSYICPTDRLLERCTGGEHNLSDRVSTARAEHHTADDWKGLPNGAALLQSKRIQAIINSRPQLRQLLIEGERVAITTRGGRHDDSMSVQRAVLISNLITAWSDKTPGHLPEREIRAIARALQPTFGQGKTDYQYQVDIDYLIDRGRPRTYRPISTRYVPNTAVPPAQRDVIEKRPRGRPTHAPEVERFYLFLREEISSAAPVKIGDLAERYGVHRRTVSTYLGELRESKRIQIQRLARDKGIQITFDDVIENTLPFAPVEPPVLSTDVRQTPIAPIAPYGETEIEIRESVFTHEQETDHISADEPPSVPTGTLNEVLNWYLDNYTEPPAERIIKRTGEIKTVLYKHTPARAWRFVEQVAPDKWSEGTVKRRFKKLGWDRERAAVRKMNSDELIQAVLGRQRTLTRHIGKPREGFHRTRLKIADEERERRGLVMPAEPAKRPRTSKRAGIEPSVPPVAQVDLFMAPVDTRDKRQRAQDMMNLRTALDHLMNGDRDQAIIYGRRVHSLPERAQFEQELATREGVYAPST